MYNVCSMQWQNVQNWALGERKGKYWCVQDELRAGGNAQEDMG